jgi:methionyl aminopeptidase
MIATTLEEIAVLREGGRRHAEILKALALLVRPGVSTQTLEDEARRLIAEGGDTPAFLNYTPEGERRPYPAALCVSINDEIVHGIPNLEPKIIKEGDLVTLDTGLIHEGLITDAAISVIAGNGSEEVKALLRAAHEAIDAGIGAARVGNTVGDIGAAIQAVADKHGYNYPFELVGHGVGLSVHEEPIVPNYGDPGEGPELEEGLVIAIEPMLMLGKAAVKFDSDGYTCRTRDGSVAAHVEHTVMVGVNGAEILTKA